MRSGGFGFSRQFGTGAVEEDLAAVEPEAGDALDEMLSDYELTGKLVSAWFLPLADPDLYLTLNGANVEGWAAAYGAQKKDFAHETAAPQWDATAFGGKGVVNANGSTQRMLVDVTGSGWPDSVTDLWMLVACREDGAAAAVTMAFAYGSTASASRALRRNADGSGGVVVGASSAASTATDFTGARTIGAHINMGGTSSLYLDGVVDGTVATAAENLTVSRARLFARNTAGADQFWNGGIACAAILNSTASEADFLALEALMRARLS